MRPTACQVGGWVGGWVQGACTTKQKAVLCLPAWMLAAELHLLHCC